MSAPNTIWNKLLITAVLCISATVSLAQERTISVLIPFSAGGATDRLWRAIDPLINARLAANGIKLVPEFVLGGGGMIAASRIVNSKETTIGIFSTALAISPVMNSAFRNFPLDQLVLVSYGGYVNMTAISAKHANKKELADACKKNSINFGSGGIGSASHLFGELVVRDLGCKPANHIPYKGSVAAKPDLVAGRLDFVVEFGSTPSAQILDIDLSQYSIENWFVVVASAGANEQDVEAIRRAFDAVKKDPNIRLIEQKANVLRLDRTHDTRWLQQQFEIFRKFITQLNIQPT